MTSSSSWVIVRVSDTDGILPGVVRVVHAYLVMRADGSVGGAVSERTDERPFGAPGRTVTGVSGPVRRYIHRVPETVWTLVAVVVVAVGLLTSEGEPVCEGPFIVSVDDSFPPQCPSPLMAVPWVVAVWAFGLCAIIAARAVVRSERRPRRSGWRSGV